MGRLRNLAQTSPEFALIRVEEPDVSVFAVSDCTPGHNQIPVALGQGAKAGIDVHFQLRDFPRDPEYLEGPQRFYGFT